MVIALTTIAVILSSNFYLSSAVVSTPRNPKKGLSFSGAQSCATLESHTDSSWWYTWEYRNGFSGSLKSFCADGDNAVTNARASGMEFVPMFWGATSIPSQPFAQATHEEFVAASNLLTFNEPERMDQANMTPAQAAALWPQIEAIAFTYDLKIVGPCMTKDAYSWYNDFLAVCTNCRVDYTCIHTYYQPMPCTGPDWECIGTTDPSKSETFWLENVLNNWYNNYGKPIWVTEYGCYPWDIAKEGCDAAKHEAIMEQQTRVFEADDRVERYNWYSTYAFDDGFRDGALNVPNYDVKHGTTCLNNLWLEGIFESRGWGIHQYHECVASAEANTNCHKPLRLSFDDESCYCSTDACDLPIVSYPQMHLYVESSTLSRDSSALTVIGQQYDSFGGNPPATPAPSKLASSSPSIRATTSPSQVTSPTKAPTVTPPLNCGAIDNSKVCNNETGGLCTWSGKNKVCTSTNPAPSPHSTPAPAPSGGGGCSSYSDAKPCKNAGCAWSKGICV